MSEIKVIFWFDVEDYITPESEDALLGLIDLLDEKNIRGTFKLVGEKARQFKKHNRTDILRKLLKHEVGFHTDMHSEHPTIAEYLEEFDFKNGAMEFEKREGMGFRDVTDIAGQCPSCYGQPGYSWAPQVFPIIKKWNIPVYLDCHDQICLDGKPFWYGGVLNFTCLDSFLRMELREGGLEDAQRAFDKMYECLIAKPYASFISMWYHPCEFITEEFWDAYNFAHGRNTPRHLWRKPPLRFVRQMRYYLDMLGQFLDYMKSKAGIEFITASQALVLERSSGGALAPGGVKELASRIQKQLSYQVYNHHTLSAADLFSLFRSYINGSKLEPELIYGPEHEVVSDEAEKLSVADIRRAINTTYPRVCGFKQLPDYFIVNDKRINPVDMTCTLAEIIKAELRDDDLVAITRGSLESMHYAKEDNNWGDRWIIFPRNLQVPNIIRMSKLQTWTLKPALF